jgi:hypothetical protein
MCEFCYFLTGSHSCKIRIVMYCIREDRLLMLRDLWLNPFANYISFSLIVTVYMYVYVLFFGNKICLNHYINWKCKLNKVNDVSHTKKQSENRRRLWIVYSFKQLLALSKLSNTLKRTVILSYQNQPYS